MKCLFGKLAELRVKSITLGDLRAKQYRNGINFDSQLDDKIHRKENEILVLQNEIIDFVNSLNGEKVI